MVNSIMLQGVFLSCTFKCGVLLTSGQREICEANNEKDEDCTKLQFTLQALEAVDPFLLKVCGRKICDLS